MDSTRPSLVDALLLERLERSFAELAGDDGMIDAPKLQKALGLRSGDLAQRVLSHFDRDGDGLVDREEFIAGVRQLSTGDDQEKLRFAFDLHDHDGDGALGPDDMLRMIALGLAEDDVVTDADEPRRLAHVLFLLADKNRDGRISFEEFEAVVRARPALLRSMTRSETRWLAPSEEVLHRLERKHGSPRERLSRYLENRRKSLLFLLAWLLANALVFAQSLAQPHPRNLGSDLMQLGRATGVCIGLNGALVLIPVMRKLLTWLRSRWLGRVLPVDEALGFHRLVGYSLVVLSVLHGLAFACSYPFGHPGSSVTKLLLETERGFSGSWLLAVLLVIWFFARSAVRRSEQFELFYLTHLLYVVWFVVLIVHAPAFLLWGAVPLSAFFVEQAWRVRNRGRDSRIVSAQALRSGVTRIALQAPGGFSYRAGDYVFLCIPAIARHEWHPFTISSAPESRELTVHVRSLGNWTGALRRYAERADADGSASSLPVRIDGPYGSPSTHIFQSRYAVMIGAGIGVTPFASVLGSLVLRANGEPAVDGVEAKLEKVHFFWLNRDQYSFEWFDALLQQLEQIDHAALLDVNICMTGGQTGAFVAGLELARDLLHSLGQRDVVTGLRTKTHMGHPDWERTLREIAEQHAPASVDVYFCGPDGLANKVRPICERLGMQFRQEHF